MKFLNKRKLYLFGIDLAILFCTFTLSVLMSAVSGGFNLGFLGYLAAFSIFAAVIFASRILFSSYNNIWRYANSTNYLKLVVADAAGGLVLTLLAIPSATDAFTLGAWHTVALSAMADVATLVSRFCYQNLHKYRNRTEGVIRSKKIGVAIVGAGRLGSILADELECSGRAEYKPICFIDTDENKIGNKVAGLPVYAENEQTIDKIKEMPIQQILIALPKLSGDDAAAKLDFYAKTGCKVKIYDFPVDRDGDSKKRRVIRDIKIEDLLFRDSLKVMNSQTRAFYADKTVLVTGGGGSIGSELCRQIAACKPKKLIIFDIYENNAYDIQQELLRKYKNEIDLSVEIGSVRDRARLNAVFAGYRPEIVLHAAAHKHVPLMEHSNCEAIKNNVMGTYNTADMAEKYGVKKFILVSTDKAVNPTNVMGASKRLCEMVIQCRTDSSTAFAAVRFGNVLGSNGSVIPLFRRQIEEGGAVTITDKRSIRYFMTIPEASGLVMQAGAMAKAGDLFVLDMGKPVRILDLAENMIKLSGLTPYKDIDIIETGLRPGEKLYEELLIKTENLTKTENDMIFIEHDTPFSREEIEDKLAMLRQAVSDAENELGAISVREAVKSAVPTFREPEEVNKDASDTQEMKLVMNA